MRLLLAIVLTLGVSASGYAQSLPRREDVSVDETPALSKNPTFLFRTLSVSGEVDHLSNGQTFTTTLGYIEPLRNASVSLGASVPFETPSPGSPSDAVVVFSDVSFRSQWIPYETPRHGVLLSTTLTLPTSKDKSVGTGKWSVTPSLAYSRFWGARFLLAQFAQQQISFAGPSDRPDVNRTDLDLYGVFSARSLQWWFDGDLNLRIDEANHNEMPSSATLTYGRGLRKVLGGSLNISLESGAGIGRYRPYDFMLSGGISLVGFHGAQ